MLVARFEAVENAAVAVTDAVVTGARVEKANIGACLPPSMTIPCLHRKPLGHKVFRGPMTRSWVAASLLIDLPARWNRDADGARENGHEKRRRMWNRA